MTEMVAVAYPDEVVAKQAMTELHALHTEHVLHVADAVMVVRDEDGVVKLLQNESDRVAEGALGGAFWGGLIGLLLLQPLIGAAVGAAVGGIDGATAEDSDQTRFIKQLGQRLSPGSAAVIALIEDGSMDKTLPRVSRHGGWVLHSSLSNDDELQLRNALYSARRSASPATSNG